MNLRKIGRSGKLVMFVLLFVATLGAGSLSKLYAEGTAQFNEQQNLVINTTLFADILNAGETINISTCLDININIWNTNGTPNNQGDDTQVVTSDPFIANLDCGNPLPNPITNAYKYTPASTGTYRITFTGSWYILERYDLTVTNNSSTDPNPTDSNGRIWSYNWVMDATAYTENRATDANLYALSPAPLNGQSFVWKLDLNKFAGFSYELKANSIGLNSPYSGISASTGVSNVTPEFPIYLGYPAIAGTNSVTSPIIADHRFLDNADQDNIFSPVATPGVQDTGNFKFTSNVDKATYAITIDTNQDNIFGSGDRLLLGSASNGQNSVEWDGKYPNGDPVPVGIYKAQIQLRTGEFHFIASDVETSGGTSDGGATWNNGLTIYRALDANTTQNTTVYWDDLTELSSYSDATSNVPNGVTSGSLLDANNDGRADGFHSWGDFNINGTGIGDENNIDTYVHGPTDTKTVTIAVASSEAGDNDGKAASIETGANNNGDGNNDGTVDFLQDNVTSLPNPVTGDKYNTIEVTGCNGLDNVDIFTENRLSSSDSAYDYPLGLLNLTVNCQDSGATANIKIYYDKVYDTSKWVARKFINGKYSNIPNAVFATETVGETSYTTLTYQVTDGGALDADGIANGVIVDPSGPAVLGATTVKAPNTGVRPENPLVAPVLTVFGISVLAFYAPKQRIVRSGKK